MCSITSHGWSISEISHLVVNLEKVSQKILLTIEDRRAKPSGAFGYFSYKGKVTEKTKINGEIGNDAAVNNEVFQISLLTKIEALPLML